MVSGFKIESCLANKISLLIMPPLNSMFHYFLVFKDSLCVSY